MRRFLIFLLGATGVALIVTACGSETTVGSSDGGPANGDASNDVLLIIDASADGADGDADPPADGPFACGSTTCGATQYCVSPCCGGAAPPCIENPDGGACPAGYHAGKCNFGQDDGCIQDACKAQPPYCVDDPSKAPVGCMKQGHGFLCVCA